MSQEIRNQIDRVDKIDTVKDSKITVDPAKTKEYTETYIKKTEDLVAKIEVLDAEDPVKEAAKQSVLGLFKEIVDPKTIADKEETFNEEIDRQMAILGRRIEVRDRILALGSSEWSIIIGKEVFDSLYEFVSAGKHDVPEDQLMTLESYVYETGPIAIKYQSNASYFLGDKVPTPFDNEVLKTYISESIIVNILLGQELNPSVLISDFEKQVLEVEEKRKLCEQFEKELIQVDGLQGLAKDRNTVVELYSFFVVEKGFTTSQITGILEKITPSKEFKEMVERGWKNPSEMKAFLIEVVLRGGPEMNVEGMRAQLYADRLFKREEAKFNEELAEFNSKVEKYRKEIEDYRKEYTDGNGIFYGNMQIDKATHITTLDSGTMEPVKVLKKGDFSYFMKLESNLATVENNVLYSKLSLARNSALYALAMNTVYGGKEKSFETMKRSIGEIFKKADPAVIGPGQKFQDVVTVFGNDDVLAKTGQFSEVDRLKAEVSVAKNKMEEKAALLESENLLMGELMYRQMLEGGKRIDNQVVKDAVLARKNTEYKSLREGLDSLNQAVAREASFVEKAIRTYGSLALVPEDKRDMYYAKAIALTNLLESSMGFIGKMNTLDVEMKLIDPSVGLNTEASGKLDENYSCCKRMYEETAGFLGNQVSMPDLDVSSPETQALLLGHMQDRISGYVSRSINGVVEKSQAVNFYFEKQINSDLFTKIKSKSSAINYGLDRVQELKDSISSGRQNLLQAKADLLAFSSDNSGIVKDHPELKELRAKLVAKLIEGIDKLLASQFSDEQLAEVDKARQQLQDVKDDMFWDIVKITAVFALTIAAALATGGLAAAGGAKVLAILMIGGRAAQVINFVVVNVAVSASTVVGSRLAMHATDVLPGSSWGDKVDWSAGAMAKEFGVGLALSMGCSAGGSLIGRMIGAHTFAKTGFTYGQLTEAGLTRFGFVSKILNPLGEASGTSAKGLMGKFGKALHVFGAETSQEAVQEIGDRIHPVLGGLLSIGAAAHSVGVNVDVNVDVQTKLRDVGVEFNRVTGQLEFAHATGKDFGVDLIRKLGDAKEAVDFSLNDTGSVTVRVKGTGMEVTVFPKGDIAQAAHLPRTEVADSNVQSPFSAAFSKLKIFLGLETSAPIIDPAEQTAKLKEFKGLSDADISLLVKLFPEGIEVSHFEQQNTGNCYLLAFLHSLKRHPIAPYVFSRMIKPVNGGWEVKFPGEKDPVFVEQWKIDGKKEWDPKKGAYVFKKTVEGQIGDKILVAAHAEWRRIKNAAHVAGQTYVESEGGNSTEPMELFLKDYASEIADINPGDYRKSFSEHGQSKMKALDLLGRFSRSPRDYILTVFPPVRSTPYSQHIGGEFNRVKYYMDPGYRFVQNHEYSVIAVDSQRRTVTVANPHDTKGKEYTISYDEFFDYFGGIEMVKFDPAKIQGVDFMRVPYVEGEISKPLQCTVAAKFDARAGLSIKMGPKAIVPCSLLSDGSLFLDMERSTGIAGGPIIKPGEELTVGRNTLPNMPDTVSGSHVKIKNLGNGEFTVTDLNSTNGTTVNRDTGPVYNPEVSINDGRINEWLQSNTPVKFNAGHRLSINLGKQAKVPCVLQSDGSLFLDAGPATGIYGGGYVVNPGEEYILGAESFFNMPNTVSGRHVKVKNLGNGYFTVTDLKSTNGTFITYT